MADVCNSPNRFFAMVASPLFRLASWSIATAARITNPLTTSCQSGETSEQHQAIVEHADDQAAEHGAQDRAAPAGERRAADHDGGDRIEFVADADLGVGGVVPGRGEQTRDAGERSAEHVDRAFDLRSR